MDKPTAYYSLAHPAPWKTIACDIDLRVGGRFNTVMQSPEGQAFPNTGCYLEIIPQKKLVWTNTLLSDFRPASLTAESGCGGFAMTATIMLEAHAAGTKYSAFVLHSNEQDCQAHAAMGFEDGWGKALEQLVAYMKTQA